MNDKIESNTEREKGRREKWRVIFEKGKVKEKGEKSTRLKERERERKRHNVNVKGRRKDAQTQKKREMSE